jgi:pimeloyl-ACP methyl ester carboxylesterase
VTSARHLEVPVDVGAGEPIVLLHGFGMRPSTYRRTAELLSSRARVLVPDLFDVPGAWRYHQVVEALLCTLDQLGIDRMTMIGHSFGGGIELEVASVQPDRVQELVFSDTLAVSKEMGLADEVLRHPLGLRHLASVPAAAAFASQWLLHPRQMASAAWWGFHSARESPIEAIADAGIRAHVLWANRDSILPRSDGRRFAERLGASFTVAVDPDGRPVDHDWMFQEPDLFVAHLRTLGIAAVGS